MTNLHVTVTTGKSVKYDQSGMAKFRPQLITVITEKSHL